MRNHRNDPLPEPEAEPDLPGSLAKRALVTKARGPVTEDSTRRRRLARRAIVGFALVLLAGIAGYFLLRPTAAEVFRVDRRDLTPSARGVGTVEAKNVVDLSSKVAGRLLAVQVDEGDMVRTGQVLATVDDVELRAALESALATVSRARFSVTAQDAGTARARSMLAAGESAEAKARAEYALAEKNARRWRQLFEEGVVAEADRDARNTEAGVGKAALAAAQAETVALRREVDAAVAAAQMAQQEVGAASAAANAIQARLGDASIVSPLDGYVVRRLLEPGVIATPGASILRVADPATAWVTIHLNEVEAGSVTTGDSAEVVLRSSPGTPVRGQVARVRRESDRVTEQLAVDITFDVLPERLILGEQAEATIFGATRNAVLAVPLSAIARSEDGAVVLSVSDDRLVATPVQLGLPGTGGFVEVTAGIDEGQLLVAAPGKLAEPGNEGRRIRPTLVVPAGQSEGTP